MNEFTKGLLKRIRKRDLVKSISRLGEKEFKSGNDIGWAMTVHRCALLNEPLPSWATKVIHESLEKNDTKVMKAIFPKTGRHADPFKKMRDDVLDRQLLAAVKVAEDNGLKGGSKYKMAGLILESNGEYKDLESIKSLHLKLKKKKTTNDYDIDYAREIYKLIEKGK